MGFFKKYNGTTNLRLIRMERMIWALIYGGLLSATLGLFLNRANEPSGTVWMIGGALLTAVGFVLIYVRSKLREET